ncbi:MAG TPA: lipopolysaccharide heptosyltransferase II [Chloroflexota bacterium]|nr:lipopolysaccharide heptosyltransferase II [Chloroflexota bacterium]
MSSRDSLVSASGRGLGALFPQRPPPAPDAVRRILVLKPAAYGDILFATPALSAIKRAYPGASITLAVGKWYTELTAGIADVDEVLDCGRFGTPGRYGWKDVWQFARAIKQRRFDLAIVLDRSPRVAIAPWLARIHHRAGIDSSGRGFALTVRVPWDRPRHEVELMLDVVRALGVECPAPRLKYVPTEEHERFAARTLEEWDLTDHAPLVVIHPGGASNPGMVMPAKRWPAPRFALLADRLVDELGARIVVVGHGADQPLARQMRLSMRHPSVDLVGQTSIGQLAALLRHSHLYIGNDSLPLHLAVAVGTPVVGMFGPTDPALNGPYNAAGVGLVHEDACSQHRPFVPGPLTACPGCRCTERITVDTAWAAASRLLTSAAHQSQRPSSA